MALREEMEASGRWLFRWRSYLPLCMVVLFLVALRSFHYPYESHLLDEIWEMVCLGISLFGLGVRILTLGSVPSGTSGRNTRNQVAKVLNTTGMYSIVRHPLYLGNFFIWLGISLFIRSWWFTFLVVLLFWLYYERIMAAEEQFLRKKFGEEFSRWADNTPAFFPNFKKWRRTDLPFSFKNVLRREYSGFFGIIVAFTSLEILGELFLTGRFVIDRLWAVIFSVSLFIYLVLRMMKKHTKILDVAER
jgi:protein-S-isoprenylcysteine O-methyltransferase Ste14